MNLIVPNTTIGDRSIIRPVWIHIKSTISHLVKTIINIISPFITQLLCRNKNLELQQQQLLQKHIITHNSAFPRAQLFLSFFPVTFQTVSYMSISRFFTRCSYDTPLNFYVWRKNVWFRIFNIDWFYFWGLKTIFLFTISWHTYSFQ